MATPIYLTFSRITLFLLITSVSGEREGNGIANGISGSMYPDSCRLEFRNLPNHTMCLTDNPDVVNSGVSEETKNFITTEHNRIRGSVIPPATDLTYLVWDARLAEVADKWARQCSKTHDENRDLPNYGATIGQNLALGLGDWTLALGAWSQEVDHFRFGEKPENYLPDNMTWRDIGHYTQIVYNTTVRLGCGYAKCRNANTGRSKQYFVCNYAAGQGFRQDFPYTNGTRCSACPDSCDKGICKCGGRICLNGGTLDLYKCHCQCPPLYGGADCKTVKCPKKDAWYCGRKWPPKMCGQFVNVPVQCPYMCGICPVMVLLYGGLLQSTQLGTVSKDGVARQTTSAPTSSSVVYEILSDFGCKLTVQRPQPDECVDLGDAGRDRKLCATNGGNNGCRDCEKSATTRRDCPVMCGLCDAPAESTTEAEKLTTRTNPTTVKPIKADLSSCPEGYRDTPGHTLCLIDSPKVIGGEVSDEDKVVIVREHNRIRGSVEPPATDMLEMVWDEHLAKVAGKWARQCTSYHDKVRNIPRYGLSIGQNAAWGSLNWTEAINVWYQEVHKYRYGEHPDSYLPEGHLEIGHYTQLVYNTTVRVGCGMARCRRKFGEVSYYFCNYAPGQGLRQHYPYMNGTRCSACPDNCVDGVCQCGGRLCLNHGTLNVTTCECICPPVYGGDECEHVDCPETDAWFCNTATMPKSACGEYANAPSLCPYMCGLCQGNASNGFSNETSSVTHEQPDQTKPFFTMTVPDISVTTPGLIETSSKTITSTVFQTTDKEADETTLGEADETTLPESTQSITKTPVITSEQMTVSLSTTTATEHMPETTTTVASPQTTPFSTSSTEDRLETITIMTSPLTTPLSTSTAVDAQPSETTLTEIAHVSSTAQSSEATEDITIATPAKSEPTTSLEQTTPPTTTVETTVTPRTYTVTGKPQITCPYPKEKESQETCFGYGNYGQDRRDCLSMGGPWGCEQCAADTEFARGFCPVMCGLCHPVCGGLRCLNGGTLNVEKCRCICGRHIHGDHCQIVKCPRSDPWYCGYHPPAQYCQIEQFRDSASQECPYMCGLC